jgi:predicted TIM-barrel fold metal-dependent hydrolase
MHPSAERAVPVENRRCEKEDMMIVDFEHHYLPEELFLRKGGKKGEKVVVYKDGKASSTLQPILCDVEEHIRIMDSAGIDVAVLLKSAAPLDPRAVLEETRLWNDGTAELIKRYPKRFLAFAPIPPLGGEEVLSEMERAVGSLGFKGVLIDSQVNGLTLDAKELWPFYKRVCALKVPIFVHPSGVPKGFDVLNASFDLYRSLGRELDLIVATTRIILGGVLDDFPDLTFVISHKGGGIVAVKERIEHWFDAPGSGGALHRMSFHEHFEKIYFNLAGHYGGMNSVKNALLNISPTRLLFGTDYPHDLDDPLNIKTYIDNIKKLEIGKEGKDLMLGGNARRLLGL